MRIVRSIEFSSGTTSTAATSSVFALTTPRLLSPSQSVFWYVATFLAVRPSRRSASSFSLTPSTTTPPSEFAMALYVSQKLPGKPPHADLNSQSVVSPICAAARMSLSVVMVPTPSHRLEARDALGLEDLHGVGLELVVAGEALVQADHALGPAARHGADHFKRQLALQADEQRSAGDRVHGLAGHRHGVHRRGEREAALEEDLVEQILVGAALAHVVDVHAQLLLERLRVVRDLGVPRLEVGLRQLEHAEAAVRRRAAVQVELARVLVAQLGDDAPHALLGDVGDGRVVLAAGGLGKLNQDELAVAAVLLVQVEHGVGGGAGAGEEVEDDSVSGGTKTNESLDQCGRLGEVHDRLTEQLAYGTSAEVIVEFLLGPHGLRERGCHAAILIAEVVLAEHTPRAILHSVGNKKVIEL